METSEQHHVSFEYFQGDITDVFLVQLLLTLNMSIPDFEHIYFSSEQRLNCFSSILRECLWPLD